MPLLPGKRHDSFDFLVQRKDPDLSGLALRRLRLKERVTRLCIAAEVPISDAQRALQASRHLLPKRWIPDHLSKLQTGLEFLDRLFVPTLADQNHPTTHEQRRTSQLTSVTHRLIVPLPRQ